MADTSNLDRRSSPHRADEEHDTISDSGVEGGVDAPNESVEDDQEDLEEHGA